MREKAVQQLVAITIEILVAIVIEIEVAASPQQRNLLLPQGPLHPEKAVDEVQFIVVLGGEVPAAAVENFNKRLHKQNKCANIFAVSTFVFYRQTNWRQYGGKDKILCFKEESRSRSIIKGRGSKEAHRIRACRIRTGGNRFRGNQPKFFL